jgi:hypothetical protein
MQFQTRSKTQAIADLATKLFQLPTKHPDRLPLIRMIEGLREELREHDFGTGDRTHTADALSLVASIAKRDIRPRHLS